MNKKESIKISSKHGLNPSIPICFWCGKDKNEILLLGKIDRKDSEAPNRVFVDYEPCEECKKVIGNNIHVIGVESYPVIDCPPISSSEQGIFYPTGRWAVFNREYFTRLKDGIENEEQIELIESILKKGVALFPDNELAQAISTDESN